MSFCKFRYRSLFNSIITFPLACILISCTGFEPENIHDPDLGIEDAEPVLVAYGSIETGSPASINLSYTKGVSEDTIVPWVYVEDAVVSLTSTSGDAEVLTYSTAGWYYGSSVIGELNTSYTVSFRIDSLEYSATSTIYPEVVIDSAFIGVVETTNKDGTGVTSHYQPVWKVVDNPNTRDYYLFRCAVNYGDIEPYYTFVLDDDGELNSGGTLRIDNDRVGLKGNMILNVYTSKIDKQTYNYMLQLGKVAGGKSTGGVTPYNPLSHFGHGSMGYFTALSSTVADIAKLDVNNLTAMPDSCLNTLSWTRCKGAVSNTIYWATDSGVTEQSNVIHIDSNVTSYVHSGLTNNIAYYYRVRVTDSWGNLSDLSDTVTSTPALLIPPVVSTRSGDAEVILTWNEAYLATQYMIYWDTTGEVSEESDSIFISSNVTTYTHDSLVNGVYYQYRMLSIDAAGNRSVLSRPEWGAPDSISITDSVPTNVTATPGTNGVVLAWDTISGAVGYAVYWDTQPWVNQWQSQRIANVTTPYYQTGLVPGTTYYYRIASVFEESEHLSAEVSAVPDSIIVNVQSPQNLAATVGINQVALVWDSVTSASGYVIYWDTIPWISTWSNRIDSVTAPYSHEGLKPATPHYYRIAAVVGGAEYLSAEVYAIPDTIPITALSPINVAAVAADTSSITITWDPVGSATGYVVYWDTNPWVTQWSNRIDSVTSPCTHTGLEQGAVIYYRVAAVVGAEEHFSERVVGWIGEE